MLSALILCAALVVPYMLKKTDSNNEANADPYEEYEEYDDDPVNDMDDEYIDEDYEDEEPIEDEYQEDYISVDNDVSAELV